MVKDSNFERGTSIHLYHARIVAPTNQRAAQVAAVTKRRSISRGAQSNEYYKRQSDSYAVSRSVYGSNALFVAMLNNAYERPHLNVVIIDKTCVL